MKTTQRGASMSGIMTMVILFVLIIKIIAGILPAYLNDRLIDDQISSILSRGGSNLTQEKFLADLNTNLSRNNIHDKKAEDLVKFGKGTKLKVTKDYEERSNFVGNVDLVVKFYKEY